MTYVFQVDNKAPQTLNVSHYLHENEKSSSNLPLISFSVDIISIAEQKLVVFRQMRMLAAIYSINNWKFYSEVSGVR